MIRSAAATAALTLFVALGATASGWIELTPASTAPAGRMYHAAVWAPGADGFYVFAGRDRRLMDDLHFYDCKANEWIEVTPAGTAPGPREGHTAVWAPEADGFYVFGGQSNGYRNELHFYDRQANHWIEVTPAGTVPAGRMYHAAVWAPGADGFYVFAGKDRRLMDDLHFYDRKANEWIEVTPAGTAPGPREGHTAVWAPEADGFYVFGGQSNGYRNELHFYDRQANHWIEVTPAGTVPAGRMYHAAVWAPGADGFYVFAGRDRRLMDDLHFYDGKANEWIEVTPAGTEPGPREGHTAVWAPEADGFYVFGGQSNGYRNELHFFDRQFTTSTATSRTTTSMTTTKTSMTMTTGTTTSRTMTTGTTTSRTMTIGAASGLTPTIGAASTSLFLVFCQI